MIKQSLSTLLCLGLLTLSACTEKKEKDMAQQVETAATEIASPEAQAATQIAENSATEQAAPVEEAQKA